MLYVNQWVRGTGWVRLKLWHESPMCCTLRGSSLEGEKKQLVTLCVSEETLGSLCFPEANAELSCWDTNTQCSAGKLLFETVEKEKRKTHENRFHVVGEFASSA